MESASVTMMKSRKTVIGTMSVLLSLPVAVALIEAVSFYVLNASNGTIISAGRHRDYLLFVPKSYDSAKPTPLVISMHGAAMWGAAQKDTSQWNTVAEREGFMVVYPSGAKGNGPRHWEEEDVTFISELIDALEAAYNIDPTRIYANGLSNGGGMAFGLSCTLSDRIAAVGMVAAAHLAPFSWCTDPRPVPMISFHGTADRFAPYHGGSSWVAPRPFPSMVTWTANWAGRNRCDPNPIDSAVAADVTRRAYTGCADDAAVVLYTINGGGHTWPGGTPLPEWFAGSTTRSIDASSQMWAFFRQHQLSR